MGYLLGQRLDIRTFHVTSSFTSLCNCLHTKLTCCITNLASIKSRIHQISSGGSVKSVSAIASPSTSSCNVSVVSFNWTSSNKAHPSLSGSKSLSLRWHFSQTSVTFSMFIQDFSALSFWSKSFGVIVWSCDGEISVDDAIVQFVCKAAARSLGEACRKENTSRYLKILCTNKMNN